MSLLGGGIALRRSLSVTPRWWHRSLHFVSDIAPLDPNFVAVVVVVIVVVGVVLVIVMRGSSQSKRLLLPLPLLRIRLPRPTFRVDECMDREAARQTWILQEQTPPATLSSKAITVVRRGESTAPCQEALQSLVETL